MMPASTVYMIGNAHHSLEISLQLLMGLGFSRLRSQPKNSLSSLCVTESLHRPALRQESAPAGVESPLLKLGWVGLDHIASKISLLDFL